MSTVILKDVKASTSYAEDTTADANGKTLPSAARRETAKDMSTFILKDVKASTGCAEGTVADVNGKTFVVKDGFITLEGKRIELSADYIPYKLGDTFINGDILDNKSKLTIARESMEVSLRHYMMDKVRNVFPSFYPKSERQGKKASIERAEISL